MQEKFSTIFNACTSLPRSLIMLAMATPKKKAKPNAAKRRVAPLKLKKTDPDFYARIGAMGGKRTLAIKGKDHFTKAARLSHAPGVRPVRAPQPDPDSPRYPSERIGQETRRGRRKASAGD
jgi:hypothetical protein